MCLSPVAGRSRGLRCGDPRRSPRLAPTSGWRSVPCIDGERSRSCQLNQRLLAGDAPWSVSSATLTSSPSLPSLRGESPSIDSLGTNDTELDTDEAIVGTLRTRRTSTLAEVWVGAGTWVEVFALEIPGL